MNVKALHVKMMPNALMALITIRVNAETDLKEYNVKRI